ncbi:MAG: 4Fe-4S binding protein [Clostridia bacterium]|nr:4Fe-4S binding protein [Clostridia bacterium]MBQ7047977.1 4Fe-4S binding protein [Clostridia bacterium]
MNRISFKTDLCKGCGLCVGACPKGLISLDGSALNAKGYHPAQITDMASCIACAMCATMCPDVIITVEKGCEE